MKLIRKIKQVLSWLPIIWKDEDWDYGYFIQIVEFKLNKIAECLEKDTIHENAKEHAAKVRETLNYFSNYQNCFDLVDKPETAIAEFRDREFYCNDEFGEYCDKVNKLEAENWEKAWNSIRDNAQCWWC